MSMKCDKLIKEAFEGIEFRYKLDDTLEELGNQKLSSKQLEGFLVGKGVSPKEIKQSGVLKGFENDNRVMTGKEWLERSGDQRLSTTTLEGGQGGSAQFDSISLGTKGTNNESYKEVLTGIKAPKTNVPKEPHFNNQIPNLPNKEEQRLIAERNEYMDSELAKGRQYLDIIKDKTFKDNYERTRLIQETIPEDKQSLLGWRRTHTDTINGSKVTVLNELQSDWAQTERAGRGTFESAVEKNKIGVQEQLDKIMSREEYDRLNSTPYKDLTDEQIYNMDKYAKLDENFDPNIVSDFPMSEVKHTQYQIVGALDEAIKNGTNKVVIPIERENVLAGSAGVTKFYDSLNKKILPEIRKKLEKQGMRIKVGKEDYKLGEIKDFEEFRTYFAKELEAFDVQHRSRTMDEMLEFEIDTGKLLDNLDTFEEFAKEFSYTTEFRQIVADKINKNSLHTLTIEEIPGNKIKWDVYALLGGLGLASQTKSEANTRKVNMGTNDNASEATVKQYFADIESSGGNYKAFNKGSKAYGKYQITPIMMKDLGITMKDLNTPTKQEAIMSKLIPRYQSRLEQFNLPVNKENMFVLHNLGMTGGIRVIKGNPTSEDITNMKYQLHGNTPKRTDNEIINNYAVTYNLDK